MDLMAARRRILLAADPDLPPGYKRVEYIRAKTNAYLSTGYIPVRYDVFEVDFTLDAVTAELQSLFSAGTNMYQMVLLTQIGNHPTYMRYFDNDAPAFIFGIQTGAWNKLTISASGVMTINSVSNSYTYKAAIDGANSTMYIFRRRNGNNPFIGKLKAFRVTNNGTLKLNLIPCIRGRDGKAGAYDTVSRTFYSSSGTEEFTPSTLDA